MSVCFGCQGAVQALGRRDRIHRRYSKEPEREAVEKVVEGQGKRGQAENPPGSQLFQGQTVIVTSILFRVLVFWLFVKRRCNFLRSLSLFKAQSFTTGFYSLAEARERGSLNDQNSQA